MKKSSLILGSATLGLLALSTLGSCRSIPKGAVAVKPFNINRYLGKWYEIARFDFRFEKNLNNTTANYSVKGDGKIKVINKGFNFKTNEWKEAVGKAKFATTIDEARLKVSFFGPFYSGYNVIAIDPDYKYALVAGESLKYLWLLSRETTMPDDIKAAYVRKAKSLGYNTDQLIWVKHD